MPKRSIIGKFEGECADSNITNLNGLDITREVWETVFGSDEYKNAVQNGWYLGFLGHPDDPNCMDFEHACIVMTSGRIADNGKIYGTFDLLDTPVGRIVKTLQDAGVTFGISVRGAGDIIDNSVDPETFVFRGFDLVTFPAYPESIPTFTAVAASSDVETQKKYKKVCAAIHANISQVTSQAALDVMKTCVASQSVPYQEIVAQEASLNNPSRLQDKLDAMTDMYIEASTRAQRAARNVDKVTAKFEKKLKRVQAIMSAQQTRLQSELDERSETQDANIAKLKQSVMSCKRTISDLKSQIRENNLNYNQKLRESEQAASAAESKLRASLRETVTSSKAMSTRVSNLDATVKSLREENATLRQSLADFQSAYAKLYASAVGGNSNIAITASTTVDDVTKKITGANVESAGITYSDDPIEITGNADDLIIL